MKRTFRQETEIRAPAEFAFAWHERPGAFERLGPPWEKLEVISKKGVLEDGAELLFRVRFAPGIWQTWHARHYGYEKGRQFCDEQVRGPFASWRHIHRFEPTGPESCRLIDEVEYSLPLQPLSDSAPRFLVEDKIAAMFAYRASVTARDIETHYRTKAAPMKVAITGAGGLVGRALTAFLSAGGHEIIQLVRTPKGLSSSRVLWDPMTGIPAEELGKLEGVDAVVHLAGESILGLWTREKKRAIRDSRIVGTRKLAEGLARLERRPKVLVSASAIGFYGNRGEEELTEESEIGSGFLAEIARGWEKAADPAREAGIRVVHPRIGVVLSPQGGALAAMKTPFSLGLGGRIGDGSQYTSWISLDDLVGLLHLALVDGAIQGPMNATAPRPVTNVAFTRTLANTLGRPALLPMPAGLLRGLLGDLANEVFLSSTRALPAVAMSRGYEFAHRDLSAALGHLLGFAQYQG